MTRRLLAALALFAVAGCHRSASAPAPTAAAAPATQGRGQHAGHHRAQIDAPPLAVVVNGKPAGMWTADQLADSAQVSMTNENGDARQGWPLQAVVKKLVGEKARVVAVDSGDERVAIDEKQWRDPARTLVLRVTHRGSYKVHWLEGGVPDEALLKDVDRIEIAQ